MNRVLVLRNATMRGQTAARNEARRGQDSVTDQGVVVLGIPIPSSSPLFLSIVAVQVAAGLTCSLAGIVAMVAAQTGRPAPERWHGLLLEPRGGLPVHDRPLHSPVASQHAPVCSRHPLFQRWSRWPYSEAPAVARLAPCAREQHGGVIHLVAHSVLRRQRTTSAFVAFAAAPGALAPAKHCWLADIGLGAETPSADPSLADCLPLREGRVTISE